MPDEQLRAKVFVSCGQIQGSEEVEIARRIADRLVQLGYDPYIATQEQTLRGVKENIFAQLESSEYFIFIDLKRERLVTDDSQFHRGSLFCHQELALASYLDIRLLAFQERGVMQQDGLMRFLQANSTPFSDRNLLPNVIADAVQQHEWDPRWKNQLCLERDPAQYVDARLMPENVLDTAARDLGRYFHIRVRNLDPRKAALNCYAYLERVRDISAHRDIRVETIEFKWAGYTLPNAAIGAGSERRLDAFWVPHNAPNVLQFNVFADSTEFIPRIRGPGDFEMTYVVVSENFAPARRTFLLHVGTRLDEIHFRGL